MNENSILKKEIKFNTKKSYGFCMGLSTLLLLYFQWFQIECSVGEYVNIIHHDIKFILSGCMLILALNMTLLLILRRINIAVFTSSLMCFIFSVINHFVYMFHGSPLTLGELRNLKTALSVAGNYEYKMDSSVLCIVAILILNLIIGIELKKVSKYVEKSHKSLKRNVAESILVLVLAILLCIASIGIINNSEDKWDGNLWSWETWIADYGYIVSLTYHTINCFDFLEEPEGYNMSQLPKTVKEEEQNENYPDIFLILDESFYDIESYCSIETDVDYLENYNSIKGAITGKAVVSEMGFTNNSEMELLTSIPMSLLKNDAPFTYFDMSEIANLSQYLKNLGYETWGMHPYSSSNYNRERAYTQMGFDHILFDEYFSCEMYGSRMYTDSSNFEEMIKAYEKGGDSPRFTYLLTYQNHGGYELNDSEYDTVHVLNKDIDVGKEILEEYLTCIKMTDDAIGELYEYIKKSDRKTICCVVGDHCPYFIHDLLIEEEKNGDTIKRDIAARSTPYIIFANYDIEDSLENDIISMTDLVPNMLKVGGIMLSPYYSLLLDLDNTIPIRTRFGAYEEKTGSVGYLNENSKYEKLLKPSLYIAYGNLSGDIDAESKYFKAGYRLEE